MSLHKIVTLLVLLVTASSACECFGFPGTGRPYIPSGGSLLSLTVAHAYPSNGAKWMSYVKGGAGTKIYNQTDAACAGTEIGGWGNFTTGCIHGGEILKVVATGYASCAGLTLSDSLSAFNWVCDAGGGTATFYSTGLLPGLGLANLITSNAWLTNSVTLKSSGTTVGTSTAAAWWTNTVTPATGNAATTFVTLGTSGTIYTVSASALTGGYRISAASVALILLNGAVLKTNGITASNLDCNGATPAATCVLTTYAANFAWIEGSFDDAGTASIWTTIIENSNFVRVNNSNFSNSPVYTLYAYGSSEGYYSNVIVENSQSSSGDFFYQNSNYGVFKNLRLANSSNYGIELSGSSHNTFIGLISVGNSSDGVYMTGSANNTFLDTTVASNTTSGIHLVSTTTTANNWVNLEMVNNGSGMLFPTTSVPASNNFNNVSAANNTTGIALGKTTPVTFTGWVIVGTNTTACTNSLTTTGLANTTCTNQGGSSATLLSGVNTSSSFYGALSVDDPSNTSDTNGSATFAYTLDFFNYANPFRLFSNGAQSTLNLTGLGANTSGTSRIWDWSLKSADTVLLNKSGSGVSANAAFTNGAACPAVIDGNQTFTDSNSKTWLVNATEVLGTGGNGNGLCESGETCIYTPNIGAYQGSGNYLTDSCTFSNGTVTGVTMYAYPTNGE